MGSSASKPEKDEALRLCGARLRFLKQAIDSRYALSAAHLAYIRSLRNVGTALRQFAEAEVPTKSSLSAFENGDSDTACPSPSDFIPPDAVVSPRISNMSYMKSSGTSALIVKMDSSSSAHFGTDEMKQSLTFPIQPPPPPPGFNSTWDYFEPPELTTGAKKLTREGQSPGTVFSNPSSPAEMEMLSADREDTTDFITHRAKDLVLSMKDIENRFAKAADSGHEVSRMLEANKIRLSTTFDAIGK